MPRRETSSRALATISSSRRRATAANTGMLFAVLTAGLALCATTQIEQDAASV